MTAPAAVRAAGVVLILALAGACTARADPRAVDDCAGLGGRAMLSGRFLLGATRGDGGRVGEAAWRRFLERSVTPRFPDELSVFAGQGRWRRPDGHLLHEPTRLLLIVVPETPQSLDGLRAIRSDYARAFAQTSVGLLLDRTCGAF